MTNYRPSETYKRLYDYIIEDLLIQICNSDMGYCVRFDAHSEPIPYIIGEKFEDYKNKALNNMSGERLDRHKLASCICGAVIEAKPLDNVKGRKIKKNANEILALAVGLNVIKFFMIYDLLKDKEDSYYREARTYLKEHFDMQFPSLNDNICDTQEYRKNMGNALFWSHHICEMLKKECFHFDIWAYAKLFYHLELYNRPFISEAYHVFKEQEKSA